MPRQRSPPGLPRSAAGDFCLFTVRHGRMLPRNGSPRRSGPCATGRIGSSREAEGGFPHELAEGGIRLVWVHIRRAAPETYPSSGSILGMTMKSPAYRARAVKEPLA